MLGTSAAIVFVVLLVAVLLALVARFLLVLNSRIRRTRATTPIERPSPMTDSHDDSRVDVSIVLPAYNPGPSLARTVGAIIALLDDESEPLNGEILVVSDGSTDGSIDSLPGDPRVRVFEHHPNRGKGFALRRGMSAARGDFVSFIDSDGDVDPKVLRREIIELKRDPSVWAAIADRYHVDSETTQSLARSLGHSGFALVTRVLFGLKVRDTQCGAKTFTRRAVIDLLPTCEEDGFVFDIELLALGIRNECGRIVSVPVQVSREGSSTISVRSAISMLIDLVVLWIRLRRRTTLVGNRRTT